MRRLLLILLLTLTLLGPTVQPGRAAPVDQPIPSGHWYSQTGTPGELGFAIVDDGSARFWSEFKRLGGVDALGYPVSERFHLDGFLVQATQRVIMQWRPESGTVMFVNVFDRLHDLGQDSWLASVRQTPPPARFDEAGKPWDAIVRDRLALMDGYPAIRAKYAAAVGDAVQANGLPTSHVVDVGNHFALRAQRVVFQQWKEDVPWARAGQVTVALGGDIAKELGYVPAAATRPSPPNTSPSPAAPSAPSAPLPASAPVATAPIAGDPAAMVVTAADAGPGANVVDDEALDAAAVARGRADPAAFAARLTAAGFARGHRRAFLVDAGRERSIVVGGEVDLFRDAESARLYWQEDASDGWSTAESFVRAERVPIEGIGEEAVAFRVVGGDSAAHGHLILFRRANAIVHVFRLGQVVFPTLDETAATARAVDARLR